MNLREDFIKYDYLVVFIRHGSAEIWGFQHGVTFGLGTLEIMARTGIFGLVVCALNCATKSDPSEPSMILAYRRDVYSRSPKKKIQVGKFTERGNDQIPPSEGRENCMKRQYLYLDDKLELSYT